MRILLETHAFLRWVGGDPMLSGTARRAIGDEAHGVFVSAASAWEIATEHRIGKLPRAEALVTDVAGAIAGQGFEAPAITVDDAGRTGQLPGPHRDPFDRLLVAQAQARDLAVLSIGRGFDRYGVRRPW